MLCLLNFAESIFCILHLVKFNEGSCADLGSVGAILSVFRFPGSTTSIVPAAVKEAGSVVTWDRSRTPRSRSSSAALQKTLMGVLAPSSRGVTQVHEDSDGYTVLVHGLSAIRFCCLIFSVQCIAWFSMGDFSTRCVSFFSAVWYLVQAQAQAASS